MTAGEVYDGSDGAATRAFYAKLALAGPLGPIAVNLFRAQKSSARAKKYRGGVRGVGSYRSMAYDRKQWSIDHLCEILARDAEANQIRWGWKADPGVTFGGRASWVLYVDLPFVIINPGEMSARAPESGAQAELVHRQVSFHAPARGGGPDYAGDWDGSHESADRIIRLCDDLLDRRPMLSIKLD